MKIKGINVKFKCKVGEGQGSKYVGNVGFHYTPVGDWVTFKALRVSLYW